MSRDLANDLKVDKAIQAESLSATKNGDANDMKGYESLMYLIDVGVFSSGVDGSNYLTFKVQTDDNDDGLFTAATDLPAGNYKVSEQEDGTAWDRVLDAAGDEQKLFRLGIKPVSAKRYYRLVATETGTTVGVYSAVALLGHGRHKPE